MRATKELLKDADDLLDLFPTAAGGKIILLVAEMAVKLRESEELRILATKRIDKLCKLCNEQEIELNKYKEIEL